MRKGRWLIITLLVIGVFTVGRKRLEPLWDSARHDPALGFVYVVIFLIIVMTILRVVRA